MGHGEDGLDTFFVYVVRCRRGTFYTGYTTDVVRRVREHNQGRGGRYTRSHGPVELVAVWSFPTRAAALRAEHAFKRLPRPRKVALIASSGAMRG